MVNIVCKVVDVGTNEKSIFCIKKQQIRTKACSPEGEVRGTLWRVEYKMKKKKNKQINSYNQW